jgi:hypothetical protein
MLCLCEKFEAAENFADLLYSSFCHVYGFSQSFPVTCGEGCSSFSKTADSTQELSSSLSAQTVKIKNFQEEELT